jgi:hypothetical protein
VAIYSNYDGGILRINVDANISNLKIGVVGYENDSIIISGTYIGNVTQVIFAGYYNSSNVHCTPWPSVKSINGVSAAITQINFVPPVTYSNPNGYTSIDCNYSCDINTNQGGCNTADQIADYFFNQFGSTHLLFHFTQYGCWSGSYNISDGGNCCAAPLSTGIENYSVSHNISVSPNPSDGKFRINLGTKSNSLNSKQEIAVSDVLGNIILKQFLISQTQTEIDLSSEAKGIYFLKFYPGDEVVIRKIILY